MAKIRRVLISVTDKTGIVDFARDSGGSGAELISTGGTARLLREAGIAVQDVSEVTGFPEMLDGRVKTLHPKIPAESSPSAAMPRTCAPSASTASRPSIWWWSTSTDSKRRRQGRRALEDLIENIDIGGPAMIRSAAKNYQDVAVVVSPADYDAIIAEMRATAARSRSRPTGAWRRRPSAPPPITMPPSARAWSRWIRAGALPRDLNLRAPKLMDLRYGENPHQAAALYGARGQGIAGAEQLHGKELSYNNLVDLDAAWQLAVEFAAPAAAIIKHTNPCGCAEQESLAEAYRKALECDPVSAYGGVIGINRAVDEETAREIAKTIRGGHRRAGLFAGSAGHPDRPRRICA